MLMQNWSGTSIQFLTLQAVAITFEDAVIALAKQFGYTKNKPLTRLVGFLWVFAWFVFSLPYWVEPLLRTGVAELGQTKYSLVLGLWKGDWTPKRVPEWA